MALKTVLESLEGLDKSLADLYTKQDNGKYILQVDGISDHPELSGLVSTMKKERDARKANEKQLKEMQAKYKDVDLNEFGDLSGLTKTEAQKMQEELETYRAAQEQQKKQKLKNEEQWEKLEQELKEQSQKELQTVEQKYQSQMEQLQQKISEIDQTKEQEKYLKKQEVVSSIAKAKGNLTILEPHIAPHVQVMEENGEFVNRVVDTSGNVRLNNKGEAMTIDDLVTEIAQKPEFQGDGIFEKPKKPGGSGSGGNQNDGGSAEKNPWKKDTWNLTEQAFILKKSPEDASRLKAAAGKK